MAKSRYEGLSGGKKFGLALSEMAMALGQGMSKQPYYTNWLEGLQKQEEAEREEAWKQKQYELSKRQEDRLSKETEAQNELRSVQTKSAKAELAAAAQALKASLTDPKGMKSFLGKEAFDTYSKSQPDKKSIDAFKSWYQANAQNLIDQGLTPQQIGAAFMDTWQKNRAIDTGTGGKAMAGLLGAGGLTAFLAAKNAPAVASAASGLTEAGKGLLGKIAPNLMANPIARSIGRTGLLGASVGAGMVGGRALGNYVADTMPKGINDQIGEYLMNAPEPIQNLIMLGADAKSKEALNSFRQFRSGTLGR